MLILRNFISASLALSLLAQCNTKTDSNIVKQILLPSTKIQSENLLIGEWKCSSSVWYTSELTLQQNGTFQFHDQGCYGKRFSQGKWTKNNGIIKLKSFDTFKQKEQTETGKLNEIVQQEKPKRKLKKSEVEYSLVLNDVSPPVLTGPNDTVRIYLDRVQLQLRNDTLYCVGSVQLPEEARFYKIKNNR
ncbi:hypothetical protein BH11BAC3_BH11BAC3_43310 [soil metagenome]